jgi:large subunit ribosomal protein L10
MVNQSKKDQVQVLIQLLESSDNFTLLRFEKTLHGTLEKLRGELRATGSKLKIVKNSLFEKAINKLAQKKETFKELRGQIGTNRENSAVLMLGEDWSRALNVFQKFIDTEKTITFKFGLLDSKVYKMDDLMKIAKLPSKDVLIAKLIGSFKSPPSRLNFALKFNLQKFVYILSEKSKQTSS